MFFHDNYAIKFASSFIVYPLNISLITYGVSQVVNFFRPFTIWLSNDSREIWNQNLHVSSSKSQLYAVYRKDRCYGSLFSLIIDDFMKECSFKSDVNMAYFLFASFFLLDSSDTSFKMIHTFMMVTRPNRQFFL